MEAASLIYILAFASAFLAVQSLMGFGQEAVKKTRLNRRLKVQERQASVGDLIIELRRERGLDREGEGRLSLRWFNELVTRSGLNYQPALWAAIAGGLGLAAAALAWRATENPLLCLAAAFAGAIGLPILFLRMKAGAREKKLGEQLPDALEIIVRSLEAGHPVPTAVALVGREMPDPIGSEFGLAADEIAYGSSLEEAVKKLAARTQQPDVELFAATVRLQAKTGGNLASLLKVNASTVRARQKMRLKVQASSSEGRASALILTSAPFIVMGAMHMLTPDFYGSVIHEKMVQYGLGACLLWMVIGNLVMRKMINFKV